MNLPKPNFTNRTTPKEIARYLVMLAEAIESAFTKMEENDESE